MEEFVKVLNTENVVLGSFLNITLPYVQFIIFLQYTRIECDCHRQAKTCQNRTGKCYCTTKGIVGDKCDKCDRANQYYGDPVKDSCFCKFCE